MKIIEQQSYIDIARNIEKKYKNIDNIEYSHIKSYVEECHIAPYPFDDTLKCVCAALIAFYGKDITFNSKDLIDNISKDIFKLYLCGKLRYLL